MAKLVLTHKAGSIYEDEPDAVEDWAGHDEVVPGREVTSRWCRSPG